MDMSFLDVIFEYAKRGDSETIAGVADLSEVEREDWARDCAKCDVCGDALLHDDEMYVDGNTGEHLCDTHSAIDFEKDIYVKSV